MTVKAIRGRRRYVLFDISDDMSKESLIHRANRICGEGESLYIIQCSCGKAIVRCSPEMMDRTIELMKLADPSSESVLASGTLRTLRDKYPELGEGAGKKPSKRA